MNMDNALHAWNPGIESQIPASLRKRETLYDPAHALTSIDDVAEMRDITGLDVEDLVVFKASRLATHSLLVRMMAHLSFDQGREYSDLGQNFRTIADRIAQAFIVPHLAELEVNLYKRYMVYAANDVRKAYQATLDEQASVLAGERDVKGHFLSRLFGRKASVQSPEIMNPQQRMLDLISRFNDKAALAENKYEHAVFESMADILGRVAGRGHTHISPDFLAKIVSGRLYSTLGAQEVDNVVAMALDDGVAAFKLRWLPLHDAPVVISLKGASASGKSSQRGMLKAYIEAQEGGNWLDFALITPDIFRKYLLDYDSLGADYRYAGGLTGRELAIIDKKLDRYIARLAVGQNGRLPHMMIDRFRRDTFSGNNGSHPFVSRASQLDMYFIVTSPENIVERGWLRGLEVGRYKAVSDFLDHSVEAHLGMRQLLFKWMGVRGGPRYRFEVLNNNVPKGQAPLLAARGDAQLMDIFDIKTLIDVERYVRVNIAAKNAQELYLNPELLAPEHNMALLDECVKNIGKFRFMDVQSGQVYAHYANGTLRVVHNHLFVRACQQTDVKAVFKHLGYVKAPALSPVIK